MKTKIPMVNLWVCPFGEIILPEDFPIYAIRKYDSLWDQRYTADERVRAAKLFLATAENQLMDAYYGR